MISYPDQHTKRKASHAVEEEKERNDKPTKISDYVPEGDINSFVTEIITQIISTLIS